MNKNTFYSILFYSILFYWYGGVTVYCTAGLGNLEVYAMCSISYKSPHWPPALYVDPHWGEWHNSSADVNPNHNHVNAALKQANLQTTSRPHY